ncbi:MAG: sulfotransferase [Candidatus Synoicihabitans palmerolidicus]|nr:sulfotransferase [Candidatus Synoicihabitans palmerolidicus]
MVGAPKCGTTFLHHHLRQHPQIFLPAHLKEPHHFAPDLHAYSAASAHLQWITDEATYLNLFADAGSAPLRGESSVYYLYSLAAAETIVRFDPTARIVIHAAPSRRPPGFVPRPKAVLLPGG